MGGNQQTAREEAANDDRLPSSANRVRGPPPLARGGVSLDAGCSTWSWRAGPVQRRSPAPGTLSRARLAARPRPAPGGDTGICEGFLFSFLRGYRASPSPGEPLPCLKLRPEVLEGHQMHTASRIPRLAPSAGRARISGGVLPRGEP